MSRYTFINEKGIITFTDRETNKQYEMTINDGIFKNVATGRTILGMPVGFGKFLDEYYNDGEDFVMRLMHYLRQNPQSYGINNYRYLATNLGVFQLASKYLNLADRIRNLGVVPEHDWSCDSCRKANLDFVNDHFKAFSAYCRATENPTVRGFVSEYEQQYYFNAIHIDKYHFTDEEKGYIFQNRNCDCLRPNSEYLPYALYYLSRGLYAFSERSAIHQIQQYFRLCEALEEKPQKEDFYRSFINAKRTYQMRKAEIDATALARNYNRKREALTFENDDFVVVIPQTTADFKAEADEQHNCVYSMYLDKVIKGETYVVFIRSKSNPSASLITCEVNRSGEIWQYLTRFNNRPTDEAQIAFKHQYQAHLREVWDN